MCFVSDIARHFRVKPRVISGLFYDRVLDDQICPVVAGRRLIPESYLPEVERVLRERGLLATSEAATA